MKWSSAAGRLAVLILAVVTGSASYVVQSGDTLSEIAETVGVPVERLIALNHLHDPDVLHPGQVLETGGGEGVSASSETSHVVKPGETLVSVASAHGVSVETLVAANGIVGGRLIVGSRLQLVPLPTDVDFEAAQVHRVRPGETLAAIASAHGTTSSRLLELNHIHEGDRLDEGRRILISPGWTCPVSGARFTNDWGWVKPDGRTHQGIDLFASRGTAIRAPVSGHLHREEGPVGGHQFTLWGDDGVRYFGSHMDSFGATGDVDAGDVIGTVGTSGNAAGTKPHLHFEMYPDDGDRSANPYPILLSACR